MNWKTCNFEQRLVFETFDFYSRKVEHLGLKTKLILFCDPIAESYRRSESPRKRGHHSSRNSCFFPLNSSDLSLLVILYVVWDPRASWIPDRKNLVLIPCPDRVDNWSSAFPEEGQLFVLLTLNAFQSQVPHPFFFLLPRCSFFILSWSFILLFTFVSRPFFIYV